jgi:hypothetical protein
MTELVLSTLGIGALGVAISHGLAVYLGLDGGSLDWRIVGGLVLATAFVYGAIRA